MFSIATNQKWKEKRKKVEPRVGSKHAVENTLQPMQDIIAEYVERLKQNGTVESLEVFMAEIAINIFAQTQLGSKSLDAKSSAQLFNTYNHALDVASDPWNIIRANIAESKLGSMLESLFCQYKVNAPLEKEKAKIHHALTENFLKNNLDAQGNALSNPENSIFPNTFITKENNDFENPFVARDENYAEFQEIIEDVSLLLLAGHETTTRSLQFCLTLLEKHPAVLNKLREGG